MKRCSSFLFFAYLSFMLFLDSSGMIRCAFLSAFIHEGGHLLAWALLIKEKPTLCVSPAGFSLKWHPLSCARWKETVILIAGPLANFICAAAGALLLQLHVTFFLYLFIASNICIGIFNCIPFLFLDGGRLLSLWLPEPRHHFFETLQILSGAFLLVSGAVLFFRTKQFGSKIGVLILFIYFIIKQKPLINCK